MGVRLRDDVIASFRLVVRTEWWIGVDLLAGLAGYVVWVAGSAALGMQVASLADYAVAPGGVPTTPVLGLLALLWLVLPAAVGVARVRSQLLNIRGNIEQEYRLDRPAALLVPPGLLVALVAAVGLAMGAVEPLLFVVLVPATLYLLVRTLSFSYRVFAFSHPLLIYGTLFATLIVQATVLLLYLGLTTENGAVVNATVDSLGLPTDPLATAYLGPVSIPIGLGAAVAFPVAAAGAYVVVQTLAALVVRVREPTIHPSRVRTGQRYPAWLDVASSTSRSTASSTSSGKATPASNQDGSSSGGRADDPPSGSAGASSADSAGDGATASASGEAAGSTASGSVGSPDETEADEADAVSHTRVFTPPGGGGDDPLSASTLEDGQECPDCGATVPEDASQCPACGTDAS